jgi:hypothetical protein
MADKKTTKKKVANAETEQPVKNDIQVDEDFFYVFCK